MVFWFAMLAVGSADAAVKIVRLLDDPVRSRMYAIQQDGVLPGAVQVLNPLTNQTIATLPVGKKPTDFSISSDGNEMLVICAADPSISIINLATLTVTGTISLSGKYTEYDINATHAHVRHGAGNLIYYTDGAWAPGLRVYNRSTATVVQSLLLDGGTYGFGDFVFNPAKSSMFAWGQYGWSAGSSGSAVARFRVNGDGTLTLEQTGPFSYPEFLRDPLDTPALISADGSRVFIKQHEFNSSSVATAVNSLSSPAYSISPQGEIAVTSTAIFETATGNRIYTLPQSSTVQAITSDYARLVYYDAGAQVLRTVDLFAAVGINALRQNPSPAAGAVVTIPTELKWTAQAGANRYQVYLGASSVGVGAATPASPLFLGETAGSSLALVGMPLIPGNTYYWRVDAITDTGLGVGPVLPFTVSTVVPSVSKIEAETVAGHAFSSVDVELNSMISGKSWTLAASVPWISLSSSSGTTPATVRLTLDASSAPVGINTATVTLTGDDGALTLPVSFRVSPLALTMIRNDPGSTKVYAISEENAASFTGNSRAYLLEIDTLFGRISRVARVGTGVTDLAIHKDDGRIYVTNWKIGSLLAVDRTAFQLVRSYAFEPSSARSDHDAYRISAGGPGRLIVEPEDQSIDIALFDTNAGVVLSHSFQREGGGAFDPAGRYYYHGDSDISIAALHKLDTLNGQLSDVKRVTVSGVSEYGSRTVVMSENGERIFWNGAVFDKNLNPDWINGVLIYSTSSDGRYAFGETRIYDVAAKALVGPMPTTTTVSGFNSTTGCLVYQSGSTVGFFRIPGASIPGLTRTPKDGTIVAPFSSLQWFPLQGATGYRVFLGTNQSAVASATTASPEYLGQVSAAAFGLGSPLLAGTRYYWRVDIVVGGEVAPGGVQSFNVSDVVPDVVAIDTATVKGDTNYKQSIQLSSIVPGVNWSASSTVPWVTFESATGTTPATLEVSLNTTSLAAGTHTGSITLTSPAGSISIPIKLLLDPLALTAIKSDRNSAKVYAISEENAASFTGTSRAYLLEIDTLFGRIDRVARVGTGVTDLAIHDGDGRIYVTNWKIGSVLAIDRATFQLVRSYGFEPFNGSSLTENDAYRISAGGPGRLVVEPEDQWVDLALFDTNAGVVLSNSFQREGGGAFDPAGRYYYHGDNDSSDASLHKLDTLDGHVTEVKEVAVSGVSYYGSRTVVMSGNGERIFWNGAVFDKNLNAEWINGAIIYSTSSEGRYAFGQTQIYDVDARALVGAMPASTTVSGFNSATGRLVYQSAGDLGFFRIPGASIAGLTRTPKDGSIVAPFLSLQWGPLQGATGYRVFLGTNQSAVAAATTASPEYLGQVSAPSLGLGSPLSAGTKYYWRVDIVVGSETASGDVQSFTISDVVPDVSAIDSLTVKGDTNHKESIQLSSLTPGVSWSASSSVSWATVGSATGTTPATLQISLSTTSLAAGTHTGSITLTSPAGNISIPVKLVVDPLALTVIKSDRSSAKVYAISEENAASFSGSSRAYLLEIDTLFGRIDRVVRTGTGVTDMAVHEGDGRIYVTNWKTGSLLAIDRTTFQLVRSYAFSPFGNVGYGNDDAYRISAGGPGRLLVEPEDQSVNLALFDTNAGVVLSNSFQREGGGTFDPIGRYYYHGDNNISDASLHKLDTLNGHLTGVKDVEVTGVSYYGSRTVLMSGNGERVFWNGVVFNKNLDLEWINGAIVYSTSSDGRYAFGQTQIYDVDARALVAAMPASTTVSGFNSATGRLVYQSGDSLGFFRIPGASVPGLTRTPKDGSIVSPFLSLQWIALQGATGYRVFLGTNQAAVTSATTASPEYLGQVSAAALGLPSPLPAGTRYYWRVDVVVGSEVAPGDVQSFAVSDVVPDVIAVDTVTVKGDTNHKESIHLSSVTPGVSWSASSDVPWATVGSATGTTPATLQITLNTTSLAPATHTGSITLTSPAGSVSIPVKLVVDPLALTVIKSDRNSAQVYAVSENADAASRAYLLEIDSQLQRIDRVVRAGTSVSDIAIHNADSRVYVTNWKFGLLLAFDRSSLSLARTYAFQPVAPYNDRDVYRIAAGKPGRLVVEPEDQWIEISLFDTVAGQQLGSSLFEREGGGAFESTGRYYYHGEDNSTGASVRKIDTDGDRLVEKAAVRTTRFSYYGSRFVVVSELGNRVFWNGSVFDPNLNELWGFNEEVFSANADGRLAVTSTKVYDTLLKRAAFALPVVTAVTAANATSKTLVLQQGQNLSFLAFDPATLFQARPGTFDAQAYLDRYPDVAALAGSGADKFDLAWQHYYYIGVLAGRTDGEFDPAAYLAQYADLRALYGTNLQAAALHWYNTGRFAGRRIPAGFDVAGYLARYPDIAARFGGDLYGAWLYYRDHGIYNGEVYDELFRVEQYLALYPELFAVFGTTDLRGALLHWLNEGRIEGRLGRIPLEFNVAGYFVRNPDVAAAVGGNLILGWQHFWNYGIYEGRAYDDEFRVFEYLALNPDLQAAFLNDWRGATLHWLRYGRTEGRLGRVPVIFNVSNYLARYPEVGASWGTAPTTVWQHFWLYGIDEARVFDEEFRVDEYLALNPDLHAMFGTDRRKAFVHWVRYGRAEGRLGRIP